MQLVHLQLSSPHGYRLFADDNCIQYSSQNVSCIEHNINHDFLVLEQWSSKWVLKFNPSKTKAVFFTLKSSYEQPEIFFQHCQLEYISIIYNKICSNHYSFYVFLWSYISINYSNETDLSFCIVCIWTKLFKINTCI